MTTSIRIDEARESESKKSWRITSGGQTYYAKPEQGLQNMIGQTIDAEVAKSEYKGKEMWWINAFTKVRQDAIPSPAAPTGGASAPTIYSASPIAPMWLPMSSNLCAAAIAAGIIKAPSELPQWVIGVKYAVEQAMKHDESDLPY